MYSFEASYVNLDCRFISFPFPNVIPVSLRRKREYFTAREGASMTKNYTKLYEHLFQILFVFFRCPVQCSLLSSWGNVHWWRSTQEQELEQVAQPWHSPPTQYHGAPFQTCKRQYVLFLCCQWVEESELRAMWKRERLCPRHLLSPSLSVDFQGSRPSKRSRSNN